MKPSQTALQEAADDLSAIRNQAIVVASKTYGQADNGEDQPILDAWALARTRFRDACREYITEMS